MLKQTHGMSKQDETMLKDKLGNLRIFHRQLQETASKRMSEAQYRVYASLKASCFVGLDACSRMRIVAIFDVSNRRGRQQKCTNQ